MERDHSDKIFAIYEVPDLKYLDKSKQLYNSIAVLDKSSMTILSSQFLKRDEVGNCLLSFEEHQGKTSLLKSHTQALMLVGTVIMDVEEPLPTRGRILFYGLGEASNLVL